MSPSVMRSIVARCHLILQGFDSIARGFPFSIMLALVKETAARWIPTVQEDASRVVLGNGNGIQRRKGRLEWVLWADQFPFLASHTDVSAT